MQQVIAFALAGWILLFGLLRPQPVQQQITPDERLRRASAWFDQRRFAEAAEEARRARELDPKLLQAWNAINCEPPLPTAEVEQIVNSIAGKELRRRGSG